MSISTSSCLLSTYKVLVFPHKLTFSKASSAVVQHQKYLGSSSKALTHSANQASRHFSDFFFLVFFSFIKDVFVCLFSVHMCLHELMHSMYTGACEGRRALDTLELELQEVVSCLMWVLGIKFRSSTSALNH